MDVLKHSASTLIIVSCIGICHLYLKTPFTVVCGDRTVLKVRKEHQGESFHAQPLILNWVMAGK